MKDDQKAITHSKDKPTLSYTQTYSQFPIYGNKQAASPAKAGKIKKYDTKYDTKPDSPATPGKDGKRETTSLKESMPIKSKSTVPGKESNENAPLNEIRVLTLQDIDDLPASPSLLGKIQDSALLEIDLHWAGNSDYFRKQIIAWDQSQFKTRLFEMIGLLDEMLKNPGQYLYLVDPFSRQHYVLNDEPSEKTVKRHYSYVGILNHLHSLLRDCREPCATNALFEHPFDSEVNGATMEKAFKSRPVLSLFAYKDEQNKALQAFLHMLSGEKSLQDDIAKAKIAFFNAFSEKQKQDLAITAKADMEAAKVAVLLQASRDLLEICKRFDICPDSGSLAKIRHLTVVKQPTTTAATEDKHGFMDFLGLLNASSMPQLESLIVEHYEPRHQLELSNLIAVLVKKNPTLNVMISHHFPEKDQQYIFSPYQDKYPGLTVKRIHMQAAMESDNTCAFFSAPPANKRSSGSEQTSPVQVDYSPK